MIIDCLHSENADDTDVGKRTVWENMNHRNLNGGPQADGVGLNANFHLLSVNLS